MRKWVAASLLLCGAVLLALDRRGDDRLFEKLWVDRVGQKPRSFVHELIFWKDGFAITARASFYRLELDALEFDHREGFEVRFLQDDRRESWKVKTWACAPGEAPDPDFVHCLSIERNGATTKYFATDEEDEAVERMNAQRRGVGLH